MRVFNGKSRRKSIAHLEYLCVLLSFSYYRYLCFYAALRELLLLTMEKAKNTQKLKYSYKDFRRIKVYYYEILKYAYKVLTFITSFFSCF